MSPSSSKLLCISILPKRPLSEYLKSTSPRKSPSSGLYPAKSTLNLSPEYISLLRFIPSCVFLISMWKFKHCKARSIFFFTKSARCCSCFSFVSSDCNISIISSCYGILSDSRNLDSVSSIMLSLKSLEAS